MREREREKEQKRCKWYREYGNKYKARICVEMESDQDVYN